MSDKESNTENAAKVASNGEEHRSPAQDAECEMQESTYLSDRIPTEEEVKRILKTPSPNIWTKQLLRGM